MKHYQIKVRKKKSPHTFGGIFVAVCKRVEESEENKQKQRASKSRFLVL